MSTRAIIARPTPGDGFEGRYHHWDGNPSGLGRTLFKLANGHFAGDLLRMMQVLCDEHPAGWSTINNADWTIAAGFRDESGNRPCAKCDHVEWEHYIQYYKSHGRRTPKPFEPGTYARFDHYFEEKMLPHGPECYCHGGRSEEAMTLTHDGDDGGAEWAYVIDEHAGTMAVLEKRWEDGGHATGFFGIEQGEGSRWTIRAIVHLNDMEPNWKAIESGLVAA